MKIKLHHLNLCTSNVEAMDKFYREVLDLEREPSNTGNRVRGGYQAPTAFVTDGTTQVHLSERDLDVAFKMKHAINPLERGHIAFRTDDLDAFKKRLDEKGIKYSHYGIWAMGGWDQLFLHDPDGNIIEVHQDRS